MKSSLQSNEDLILPDFRLDSVPIDQKAEKTLTNWFSHKPIKQSFFFEQALLDCSSRPSCPLFGDKLKSSWLCRLFHDIFHDIHHNKEPFYGLLAPCPDPSFQPRRAIPSLSFIYYSVLSFSTPITRWRPTTPFEPRFENDQDAGQPLSATKD